MSASSAAQLGDAVADLAPVELERALAGAFAADAAALAVAARAGLAQPRREVVEARDLDLELRLAALGVAVEDLDDHARAVEHLAPVARSRLRAWRGLMSWSTATTIGVARLAALLDRARPRARASLERVVVALVVAPGSSRALLLPAAGAAGDDAAAPGVGRELAQLAFAEHGGRGEGSLRLAHGADDVVAQGVDEAPSSARSSAWSMSSTEGSWTPTRTAVGRARA
jgi:hypothetical protein